jgi:hypothetical protein
MNQIMLCNSGHHRSRCIAGTGSHPAPAPQVFMITHFVSSIIHLLNNQGVCTDDALDTVLDSDKKRFHG